MSYYDLLEVSPSATTKEIKKGFRNMALRFHPDKIADEADKAKAEEKFIRLTEAHTVLGNDDTRERYNHLLTRGIFEYDEKAYDRTFSGSGHQRSYEETAQRELVEIVMGCAVLVCCAGAGVYAGSQKKNKRSLREIKKDIKDKIDRDQEEIGLAEEEAKAKANILLLASGPDSGDEDDESEDPSEVLYRKQLRNYRRKLRLQFRQLLQREGKGEALGLEPAHVTLLCESLPLSELQQRVQLLCVAFDAGSAPVPPTREQPQTTTSVVPSPAPASVIDIVQVVGDLKKIATALQEERCQVKKRQKEELAKRRLAERLAIESKKRQGPVQPWSASELTALARGVVKFPDGYVQRWEAITKMVNAEGGCNRSAKEIIKQSKSMELRPHAAAPPKPSPNAPPPQAARPAKVAAEWTASQQAAFESGLRGADRSSPDRWQEIADKVPGKTRKDVVRRFKEIQALVKEKRTCIA